MEPTPPSTPPPESLPAGSPFRPEPEHPRLGIFHLMVLTTCVAVYFSVLCLIRSKLNTADNAQGLARLLGFGIGSGAALAGLLLWPARRYRGLPFPTQPGERLLILLGMGALLGMLGELIPLPLFAGGMPDFNSPFFLLAKVFSWLTMVVLGVFYLMAILRTKILRWRLYFIAAVTANYVLPVLLISTLRPTSQLWFPLLVYTCPGLLGLVFLMGVILCDVFQKVRYRWPHWLGVAIALWNGAIMLALLAQWWILSAR